MNNDIINTSLVQKRILREGDKMPGIGMETWYQMELKTGKIYGI